MLARIRAATSGSLLPRAVPCEARSPAAWTPGVVRDLDLTAAYGIEVACPRKA